MSFFSRLFGNASPTQLKSPPVAIDANSVSDIVFDAKSAAAILDEIDIDTAIAAHENWKVRLQNVLNDQSSETLQPEVVCMDDRCDLGKWLHGPGGQRLGKYPAFSVLVARHKYFHVQASTVLALAQGNDKEKAQQTLDGSYRQASSQVVLLLKQLKRGLSQ